MKAAAQEARPRHPAVELLGRYYDVFKAAWEGRRDLIGPQRMTDEVAFLPAALSLQETPASPAPRRAAWAICALFSAALVWAIVGRVDIVAVAPGRIVVSDRTKIIQPLEAGVIKRVLVKDGDIVKAGQVLVELDGTNATADGATVQEQLTAMISEQQRTLALLASLKARHTPQLPDSALLSPRDAAQLRAEWQDITAKLARLSSDVARRRAEITTVQEAVAKLQATLPLSKQREDDFRRLRSEGFVSDHAGQDRTRERIEQERDLAMQRARLAEAQAALVESESERVAYVAETQRSLNDRQAQATSKREQLEQERAKTDQRTRMSRLTAPVAGTVQQLAVHTEGGVVTPAQALMIIVPRNAEVTAEVVIDNKDIGFVQAGQLAAIKLETFPFTRYGTISAKVARMTADAVTEEKRGAIFPAVLMLERDTINVDGKAIRLTPGMNVTAEIKTGRRRVIEYLLAPVQTATGESFGER